MREAKSQNPEPVENSEFPITASHLLEYLFCPKFAYFEYVLDTPLEKMTGMGTLEDYLAECGFRTIDSYGGLKMARLLPMK